MNYRSEICAKNNYHVPQPWLNIFFEKQFSKFILNFWAQTAAGLLYAVYLGGAVFCLVFYMDVGLQVSNLVPYRSVSHSYLNVYENFFTKCSTSAEIILANPNIDYEDNIVRRRILSAAKAFEFTNFTYKIDFWLQEFEEFTRNLNSNLDDQDDNYNGGYSKTFYHFLNNVFLATGRFRKYKEDLNFACCKKEKRKIYSNNTTLQRSYISSSRFYVQLINMGYENRSAAMHMLKDMVENYSQILGDMYIYDVSFPLAEQHDNILSVFFRPKKLDDYLKCIYRKTGRFFGDFFCHQ
uniref:Uncharacterized protein n=1 Tax=Romanomermis culicivorax TaxID=13658 RepID=A0A915LCZ2_ROMCU